MVGGVVALALASITIIMLSMAGAYRIGELLGSIALGFLAVGAGYLVLLLLFFLLWKSVIGNKVQLAIINAFHDND